MSEYLICCLSLSTKEVKNKQTKKQNRKENINNVLVEVVVPAV